jgi:hypothetical protein
VIWVEDKLGADPHDNQIANYLDELPRNVLASAVVLLAPRSSLPYTSADVPEGARRGPGRRLAARCGCCLTRSKRIP